jgi:hypothetical protein
MCRGPAMIQRLRRFPLPFIVVLGITALLAAAGLTRGLDWDDDDSQYIMQAISILERRPEAFIESSRFTMEQSSEPIGPIAYPWGLPLMLAPVYAAFGPDMLALKTLNIVCFLLFLITLWLGVRRHLTSGMALACVSLCAINPSMLLATDQVLSDIPFLFLSTLCVVMIGIVVVERRHVLSPAWDHALLGVVAALAFLFRTNGVLLVVTLVFAQVVSARVFGSTALRKADNSPQTASRQARRRWRGIALGALPYAAFAGVVLSVGAFLPEGGASHWRDLRRVTLPDVARQMHYYIDLPSDFFEVVPHEDIVFGATIPLFIVGAIGHMRHNYHVLAYMFLSIGVYVLWPHREGLRFLFPLLPFYLWLVLSSVERPNGSPAGTAQERWKRAGVFICVLGVLLWFGRASTIRTIDNLRQNRETPDGPFTPTSQDMFAFIRAHTAPDSTIIFFKPRGMRLWTARNSIRVTRAEQLGRGDYVCVYRRTDGNEKFHMPRADVERAAALGQLQVVYENTDFTVYRLNRSALTTS